MIVRAATRFRPLRRRARSVPPGRGNRYPTRPASMVCAAAPELDDDVVTETVAKPAGEAVAPTARVIPTATHSPVRGRRRSRRSIPRRMNTTLTKHRSKPTPRCPPRAPPRVRLRNCGRTADLCLSSPPQVVYIYPAQQGVPVSGGASRVICSGAVLCWFDRTTSPNSQTRSTSLPGHNCAVRSRDMARGMRARLDAAERW